MSRKSALTGSHRCRDNSPVAGRVTQALLALLPYAVTTAGEFGLWPTVEGVLLLQGYRHATVTPSSLVGGGDHDEWSPIFVFWGRLHLISRENVRLR